jgi:hypothetical protein
MDVSAPVGIGTDFLGYRIEELIGRGGMGVVYRAYDLRLKRPVALKLVAPSLAQDERFRERFARESELVMSLEHPNVVPIHDAGDFEGRVYLAMRLVDGTDLGSLLRTEGALEPTRAIAICAQIASALDAAHARGLVHRDVKPSNVLLDRSEHVYLADFGLTRRLDDDGGVAGEATSAGTPAYLAPEQLEGGQVDGRADIYSLGCVLYECLTGEPIFPRSSRLAVAWAHLEEEPPRASLRRAELPQAIDAVLDKALAKDPEQRYPTCEALVSTAREALGLQTARPPSRRRTRLLATGIVLVIAAAASVASVLATDGHGKAGPLLAADNTLARIDVTDKVGEVIPVGADPVVLAADDDTVWTYSRGSESITQVDAVRNRIVDTTRVAQPAACCSLFTGPVLTADASGAWFVEGAGGKSRLVHIPVGHSSPQVYRLPITPTGVAAGGRAVWVVGHNRRNDLVLRIVGGHVTPIARFPLSVGVDSITFAFGSVWALSSKQAKLYRIDRHTGGPVKRLVLVGAPATRPEILFRDPTILVNVAGAGTKTYWIDPYRLTVTPAGSYGPPGDEENIGTLGSLWWYDWTRGDVYRQQAADGPQSKIKVTRPLPAQGGPCITSMAEVAGSIWVAVAPSVNHTCKR